MRGAPWGASWFPLKTTLFSSGRESSHWFVLEGCDPLPRSFYKLLCLKSRCLLVAVLRFRYRDQKGGHRTEVQAHICCRYLSYTTWLLGKQVLRFICWWVSPKSSRPPEPCRMRWMGGMHCDCGLPPKLSVRTSKLEDRKSGPGSKVGNCFRGPGEREQEEHPFRTTWAPTWPPSTGRMEPAALSQEPGEPDVCWHSLKSGTVRLFPWGSSRWVPWACRPIVCM